ncbi:alpha/beta hydrolase [Micromonospora zhanjiangensis]|uniref:Alpha/beta hydrolase n=1 Tax=Micromonospora zhanjiangensis TaxID=1522057 RepID=A0ABV8KN00_9ACTN
MTGTATGAPALTWRPHDSDPGYQVATVAVPRDHGQPGGPTIDLEIIRRPAADPQRRLGTLFFVPGGPAFPGVTLLPSHHRFLPAEVRERFDVVSLDPRGSGASTPVHGFVSMEEAMTVFAGLPQPFPVNDVEGAVWIERFTQFGALVRERNADLLPYISTTGIAHDIALLADALGEEQINFYGISYGALLGVVLANLYPQRVRAMVLDGSIDPVAWYHPDAEPELCTPLRVGFDLAADAGLNLFLDLAGASASPFSAGSPEATRAKFATLLQRLRDRPVRLSTPAGEAEINYGTVIAHMWVTLYQTAYWDEQARRLQDLWLATEADDEPYVTAFDFSGSPEGADVPPLFASPPEQSLSLLGGDAPAPADAQSWFAQTKLAEDRAGGMGSIVAWPAVATAGWPAAAGRYTGPWDRRTAAPVLFIGVTGDPGTPYEVTRRLSGTLPGARLLTVDGVGHTTHYNPDERVHRLVAAYLADGELPPPGTTLRQENSPFRT